MSSFSISANLIDLFNRRIYPARVGVAKGKIISIAELEEIQSQYILPGFVDAHVHIESSMLVPTEFARLAAVHGTVATVSDPHEIANVCGIEGVEFMIHNGRQTPFKFFFGASSCVPATPFETAGATLDARAVEALLDRDDIWYLAEMMNYPGVLNGDPEVIAKIKAATKAGKLIDGHAPGLRGVLAAKYAGAGITTDHECFSAEEALDKIHAGMHILIREGSAARNFEALIDLIRIYPQAIMFCSDDKHPDELVVSHINNHVKKALQKGYDIFDVLRAASVHPVLHYNLPVGLLRINDPADFILINNPSEFDILQTYIDGELAAEQGRSLLPRIEVSGINNFEAVESAPEDFRIAAKEGLLSLRVIEALEGQLITRELIAVPVVESGNICTDPANDILKIAILNRYEAGVPPSIALIKNFGLKQGAIASTVAHDCHNIIAVGVDDASISAAINALVRSKGGISVAKGRGQVACMPLPVGGLMSTDDGYAVAERYSNLDLQAKELGSLLKAPFMTLSFMALLVIPALKLSNKGLFDGESFSFTDLQILSRS